MRCPECLQRMPRIIPWWKEKYRDKEYDGEDYYCRSCSFIVRIYVPPGEKLPSELGYDLSALL